MTEITRHEFTDLKEKVSEISVDVKKLLKDLNSHVLWEADYQAQFRQKLEKLEGGQERMFKLTDSHEDRLDKYDVWKAGLIGHIRGMWFAIGTLIPVILGIILKVIGVL